MRNQHPPETGRRSGDPASVGVVRRAAAAAAIGNAMEWYDFSVVTLLGAQFFPFHYNASIILLALGFVMRTPGGIFLGPLGDMIGRKRVLVMTVLMMSGGTFLIGCLPTFYGRYSFGYGALVLVILLRMVQGFSTGGEYVGAATFMAEYAPARKRGFYGSFLEVGTLTGYVAGALMVLAITLGSTPQFFSEWGWRIPFLTALLFGLFGLYLRWKLEDTPTFNAAVAASGRLERPHVRKIITGHWRMILNLIGIVMMLNIADYMLLTTMPRYFKGTLHVGDTASTLTLVLVEAIMLVTLPFLGALSDRIGRKPLLITSATGYIVLSYPCFWLMEQRSTAGLIAGFLIMGLLLALILAVIASTFPAMFPTRVRYGAFAIGYNLSTSIFGGTTSLVITTLIIVTGNVSIPAFYLILAGAIGLIPILIIPETFKVPMDKIEAQRAMSRAVG
ncbi:MAG: MFS transporter [Nocardiopsaceae bacterium]|nr:MFS transporter [Nocardiopsaceae bacterium]